MRSPAGLSVSWLSVRIRWVAPVAAVLVTAGLVTSLPLPAAAGVVVPPGASTEAPSSGPSTPVQPLDAATTEQTQGGSGPGVSARVGHADPAVGSPSPRDWRPTADRPGGDGPAGFREGASVEDTSARTATTTEYVNPDGSRTRKVFQEVAFVPDASGQLRTVDATLRASAVDGRLEPTMALSPVSFAPSAGAADLVRLDAGDGVSVGFGVEGAAPVAASVVSDSATYVGVRTDADVVLSATTFGMKDEIVLRSVAAPTSWVFGLRTLGVTPQWDEASRSVKLIDRRGNMAALIPPGFMVDSSFDTRTGAPATSTGVTYTLLPRGTGWALQVDLDQAWLADPARVWPVTVDPPLSFNAEQDDTFVSYRDFANQNNSSSSDLLIGTYDWGGEVAESYLHFDYAMSQLSDKYVTAASLSLFNYWSYSCTPSAASVHAVGQPWVGWSATSWASRPAYFPTALDTESFANGYTGCAQGPGWATWNIAADQVRAWAFGQQAFYGFVVRASYTDALGWKRFRSSNYSDPAYWPALSVTYSLQPAGVALTSPLNNGVVDSLTPTLWVRADNPTNAPVLQYQFKVCSLPESAPTNCHEGPTQWQTSPAFAVPSGWLSGWSREHLWWVNIDNGSAPSGWLGPYWFTPVITQPGVTSHLAGAPEGADLAGVNPQVGNFTTSATDASVAVVGPSLSVMRTYNSQDLRTNGAFGPGWSTPWDQRVEVDGDGSGSVVVTLESGRQVRFGQNPGGGSYAPPPGMNLDLVYVPSPATWTLRDPSGSTRAFDGMSGRLTSVTDVDGRSQTYGYTAAGAQGANLALNKSTTTSTTCNGNQTGAKAVNGSVNGGASDKWCSSAGSRFLRVDLGSAQTVSSAIVKHAGAGGETVSFNTRDFDIAVSTDASTWTTVAAVTGNTQSQTVHEFAPVTARYVQLNVSTPTQNGNTSARVYEFEVYGGTSSNARWLHTVTDAASGRALHVAWTGNVVSTVDTDVPAVGEPALHWSYTYASGRLASVCTPLRAGACHTYTYTSSSHYRSVVADDGPAGYWPLGETSGDVATNVAARTTGQDGTYNAVTLDVAGALGGSPDRAATFAAGSGSSVALPEAMLSSARNMAVEVWFKAASGASGNLVAEQNSAQTSWAPLLYVGTDGTLRGMAPVAATAGQVVNTNGLCLQTMGSSWANGTGLELANCGNSNAQRARTYPDGTIRVFGKCLDIAGGNPAVFTPIVLWDCHGSWNQVWEATPWGGVGNPGSTTCLGYDSNTFAALTFPCEVQPWDLWTIPAVTAPMASISAVTDGQWHHAVLTAGSTGQTLYLDGVAQATITGAVVDHRDADLAFVGNGKSNPGLPAAPGAGTAASAGDFGFTGQIDEVAYYRHPLAETDVKAHMGARGGSVRLNVVTEPVAGVATTVTGIAYNHATGRINTVTDRHGATWTLDAPTVNTNEHVVRLSNNATPARSIDYTYDSQRNGRITARAEQDGGTRRWTYNDTDNDYGDGLGFVEQAADENANVTTFTTDGRGNVTQRQTCRAADDCQTQYFGYYLNGANPLDPRNDVQVWSADARSADDEDETYRTDRDVDLAGRPLTIVYPMPAGQVAKPAETFTYTPRPVPYTPSIQTRSFIAANDAVLGVTGDAGSDTVTFPFPVTFFGQAHTTALASADGYLTFAGESINAWENTDLPNPDRPNDALYAFWDDLEVTGTGSVRTATLGSAPNRQFVVEWRHVEQCCGGGQPAVSFEIVFAESGEISFNYAGISTAWATGTSATVGIEDATGLAAQRHSVDQGVLANGTAVVYTPTVTPPPQPGGLLAQKVARNGATTTYTYNTAGDLVSIVDPAGLSTTNTYDNLGRIRTTTRSAGATSYGTTTFTYNGLSLPETITGPSVTNTVTAAAHQAKVSLAYNDMGQPTSQTVDDIAGSDPDRVTTWQYDTAGRLRFTTNPDATVVEQRWNTAGDVTDEIQPTGLRLLYAYDFAHRRTTTKAKGAAGVDPENLASTADVLLESRSYDPAGRLAAVVDAKNRITRYAYLGDNLLETTQRVTAAGPPEATLTTEVNAYDPAGYLTTRTTPGPNTAGATTQTTYTYDPAGNLVTQAVDPAGLNRVTTHSYNPDSSIAYSTATGAASPGVTEKLAYTYDNAGRVLTTATVNTVTSAALTTILVRDARGLVTQQTDPSGVDTFYTYDLLDRPVTATGEARDTWANAVMTAATAPVTELGYNTFGDVTHQRDPNTNVTVAGYNQAGQPTTLTQPAYTPPGGSPLTATTTTRYTNGLADTVTDSLGNVTTATYDPYGRIVNVTEPDPDGAGSKTAPQWTYAYNRDGELVQTTLPTGAKTGAEYDILGRQTKSSETEAGATYWWHTLLEYDDAGNRISSKTPQNQYVTSTTYNAAGEITRITDHTGRFTAAGYDLAGRPTYTVSGRNATYVNPRTTTAYDFAGRATTVSDCAINASTGACTSTLRTTTSTFDNAGRTLSTTSAAGRPSYYGYDTGGQLTTVTQRVDPANAATAITVQLGYDPAGNRTRMIDGNANATTYTYNSWNLPESVIEPSTVAHPAASDRTWTTSYNAVALPDVEQLPGGVSRTRTYDNLGRLTGETGTGATTTARSLDYDPLGRLTSATSPAGNHTYTWTDRGLLAAATGYGGSATFTYDGEGMLTQRVDTAGTATFTYDGAGRLLTVADPLTGTTIRDTYDNAGRLQTSDHGAGTAVRTYAYDQLGRPDTDTLGSPGTASIDYGFDLDDLLTSKTTTGTTGAGANTYTYDGLGRIASWTNPASQTTGYGYDAASNRTTVTTAAGTRTSTYDARNRITATTGAGGPADSYTYNPRGQLTGVVQNGQSTTYTYDAFERLTQATGTATPTTSYTYDSLDRVAQRNASNFGYDDLTNNPVISPAAAGETRLLRDPRGTPLAAKTGASAGTALVNDPLHGDTIATANPTTGALNTSALYDPWGGQTLSGAVPLGYQGGYTDPDTTLTNAHARWYNPSLGGFATRDTWTLHPVPAARSNRYLYANASPLNWADPTGHDICTPREEGILSHFVRWVVCLTQDSNNDGHLSGGDIAENAMDSYCSTGNKAGIGPNRQVCETVREAGDLTAEATGAADWLDCIQGDMGACAWAAGGAIVGAVAGAVVTAGVKVILKGATKLAARFVEDLAQEAIERAAREAAAQSARAADEAARQAAEQTARAAERAAQEAAERAARQATRDAAEKAARDAAEKATRDAAQQQPNAPRVDCHSFRPDTPVLMADGTTRPIRNIQPNDAVLATDPGTGATTTQTVTAVHINTDTDLTDVTVKTEDGSESAIHTTSHHLIWDDTDKTWINAASLTVGHRLRTTPGARVLTIAQVNTRTDATVMLDLTVSDTHTYYVLAGDTPVLVHNCDLTVDRPDLLEPGPWAQTESGLYVPTNSPFTTAADRAAMQEFGPLAGCHSCSTRGGPFIPDHMDPVELSPIGGPWKLLPQCATCSGLQSTAVRQAQALLRNHGQPNPNMWGTMDRLRALLDSH